MKGYSCATTKHLNNNLEALKEKKNCTEATFVLSFDCKGFCVICSFVRACINMSEVSVMENCISSWALCKTKWKQFIYLFWLSLKDHWQTLHQCFYFTFSTTTYICLEYCLNNLCPLCLTRGKSNWTTKGMIATSMIGSGFSLAALKSAMYCRLNASVHSKATSLSCHTFHHWQ